jgi:hypothetical protein
VSQAGFGGLSNGWDGDAASAFAGCGHADMQGYGFNAAMCHK